MVRTRATGGGRLRKVQRSYHTTEKRQLSYLESVSPRRARASGYLFLLARLREVFREVLRDDLRGTFAPFFRASLSPIAMACLRLFTFWPEPLRSVPFFLRRIVDSTFFEADLPYFAMLTSSFILLQSTC